MRTTSLITRLLVVAAALAAGLANAAPTVDSVIVQGYMKKANDTAVTDGSYDLIVGVFQGGTAIWAKRYSSTVVAKGVFSVSLNGLGTALGAIAGSTGMNSNFSGVTFNPGFLNTQTGTTVVRVYAETAIDGANPQFDIPVGATPTAFIADTANNVAAGSVLIAGLGTSAYTTIGAAGPNRLAMTDGTGVLDLTLIPTIPASQVSGLPTSAGNNTFAGNQTFSGDIAVAGSASFAGPTYFTGQINAGAIQSTAIGVTALTATNIVTNGTSAFTGNAGFGGTISSTGAITSAGAITSGGTLSGSALSITNGGAFGSTVGVGTTLAVGTDATVGGILAVTGTSAFAGASVHSGLLSATAFPTSIASTNDITAGGGVFATGLVSSATLAVSGTSAFVGNSVFSGNSTVGGTLTVTGTSAFTGNSAYLGNMAIVGTASVRNLVTSGTTTLGGALIASNPGTTGQVLTWTSGSAAPTWVSPSPAATRSSINLFEDFYSGLATYASGSTAIVGTALWTSTTNGPNALPFTNATGAGAIRMQTGLATATNGLLGFGYGTTAAGNYNCGVTFVAGDAWTFETKVSIANSTPTNQQIIIGLVQPNAAASATTAAETAKGVYLHIPAGATTVNAAAHDGTIAAGGATSSFTAATFARWTISYDGVSTATFSKDGTPFTTVNTHIPTGVPLCPVVMIQNSAAAVGTRTVDVDYVSFNQTLATPR